MATNKNATIRYQVLDRCFRNPGRRYYITDLIEVCNEALLDIDSESTGVKRRQIYDDIKFMQDSRGFEAPIESNKDGRKAYYRYSDISFSINNQPLNEQEAQQLKESLLTLSRFKGLPQFEWVEEIKARLEHSFNLKTEDNVLSFEENIFLTGRKYIGEIYNAIVNKQVIKIIYHAFKRDDNLEFLIHPYHLKQYNNRWFLFGLNENNSRITNVALDRIVSVETTDKPFKPSYDIDFEEYFDDIIGVSIPYEGILQKVILKIDKEQWPYINTKPLHGSQKVKEITPDFTIVELELIQNYELESLILSFGDSFEVIEPESLRHIIKKRIKLLNKKYNICAD